MFSIYIYIYHKKLRVNEIKKLFKYKPKLFGVNHHQGYKKNDFRGNRSVLVCLNLVNVRKKSGDNP